MKIAVVGGGIAGLTTAVALTRAGVRCQVFEQTRHLREIGAGIQLSPNGSRPLHRLGLGPALRDIAVRPEAISVRRWDSGEELARTSLGSACEDMYGTPYYTVHRAELHQLLLEQLPRSIVHLGMRCVQADDLGDSARLHFDDGSTADADAVIGADGIRSAVRAQLLGDQPRFSGHQVFRGVVPARHAPRLAENPRVAIWMGPGQHCVAYPISGGRLISFAASAPAGDWSVESWTAEGHLTDLLDTYGGWAGELRELLSGAPTVTRWALHDRPPVDRWTTGRLALVGDAAHPMLPFGAQGASQAIEDAMVLAACLASGNTAEVPETLKRYESVRRPRTEQVQRFIQENERNHHVDDGQAQQKRDIAMDGEWALKGRQWLFGYDYDEEEELEGIR
ncbi:FAD-dependent monooxygenase [Streptomyces sp. NPDC047022]|uniref:FAD-dependent monooxygenase n=1 Tax=Streptomyces sp. NPDC047022 TaxID=3155737 RepID=UPI0033F157DE